MELSFDLRLELPCYARQELRWIDACELGEPEPDDRRPSLTVRPIREGESLWSIAKACRSTVAAICAANDLDDRTARPGVLLLIPRQG